MRKLRKLIKAPWLLFVSGLVVGVLVILGIRFVTYEPVHTHYHANFGVYINGEKEEFKGPQYYQEVSICSATSGITIPQQRAHLHEEINSVIHVHDQAVTWGQFFENLGWIVGPNFIQTDNGTTYAATDQAKLHILINGQDYTGLTPITNMLIEDKARLLISFGDTSENTLQKEYKTVPATAARHNASKDPASCAGQEKVKTSERFRHLF